MPVAQPSPMRRAYRAARAARVALARQDINSFIEYVLRDEETGEPIKQSDLHRTWHQALDQHSRVMIWSHIASGKTQQLSIGRVLFELGKNPGLRVVVASNAEKQAEKLSDRSGST